MFANRYTALVDACTLARVLNRNLLLSLAERGFFRIRWSDEILAETQRAIEKMLTERGCPQSKQKAAKSIRNMRKAFPEANVDGVECYLGLNHSLPDLNDEHVLAAALKAQAQTIVTENLRDFPELALAPYNLEARSSDAFIADTIKRVEGRP